MGELVATLALAQDNAFGQPLESNCGRASWPRGWATCGCRILRPCSSGAY